MKQDLNNSNNNNLVKRKVNKTGENKSSVQLQTKEEIDNRAINVTLDNIKSSERFQEILFIIVLVIVGLITRLYQIDSPPHVVFDEVHTTKYITWYLSGHHFVDTHPPLAKLIFAGVLYFSGFEGSNETDVKWWTDKGFEGTGDWKLLYTPDHHYRYVVLRTVSAVAGVILVLITYITARSVGCGRLSAFFASWLVLCDNLITLQSRLILTDVFLYVFHLSSISASFKSTRDGLTVSQQFLWCIITGILLGCALSVKFTGLGTLGTVGIHQLLCLTQKFYFDYQEGKAKLSRIFSYTVWRGTLILGSAICVCTLVWIIHILVLPYSGQGDPFMSQTFKYSLLPKVNPEALHKPPSSCPNINNAWSNCGFGGITRRQCEEKGCCFDSSSPSNWCYHKGFLTKPKVSMYTKVTESIKVTWKVNDSGAVLLHPSMSEWWQWPLMRCRLINFGGGLKGVGNPLIWWLIAIFYAIAFSYGIVRVCSEIFFYIIPIETFRTTPQQQSSSTQSTQSQSSSQSSTLQSQSQSSSSLQSQSNNSTNSHENDSHLTDNSMKFLVTQIVLFIGYLGNLLPFHYVQRSKFHFHYIPALLIGIIHFSFCLECLISWIMKKSNDTKKYGNLLKFVFIVNSFIMIGAFISFCWWSPWTYGFPLLKEDVSSRKLYSFW